MDKILVGATAGLLSAAAVVILIHRSPILLRRLLFRFGVASDFGLTVVSTAVLPIRGAETLIAAGVYLVLISAYIHAWEPARLRSQHGYRSSRRRDTLR